MADGLITIWILRCEGLAAGEVGSGDDDGTGGVVDCVVIGLYADGWATTEMLYLLPTGNGDIEIEGEVPDMASYGKSQTLTVICDKKVVTVETLPPGGFRIVIPAQKLAANVAPELTIRASCFIVPNHLAPDPTIDASLSDSSTSNPQLLLRSGRFLPPQRWNARERNRPLVPREPKLDTLRGHWVRLFILDMCIRLAFAFLHVERHATPDRR